MRQKIKRAERIRLWVQVLFTALTNGYALGFLEGKIYKGSSKRICVPGLNCYSCPGAVGSCPIGSLQAVLGSSKYQFSFYVIGFLMVVGSLGGRFVCGWMCPFGLIQDLLHKIPFLKKVKKPPFDRQLRYLKYVILVVFVIILPMTVTGIGGNGDPWFCKWICPSGTLLAGLPLISMNEGLRQTVGLLFGWKTLILLIVIVASVKISRPFCRYVCPLGAIYGIFNKFSLLQYHVDAEKCIQCGLCEKECPMAIRVDQTPDSPECIRCGKCIHVCPKNAVSQNCGLKK